MELKEVVELMEVRAGAKKRVPTPVVRSVSTPVNDNMSAPSSNNQNNEVLKKLTRLNHALACSAHGGSYCLVPNKNTGATILQYGLKLEHLRISDSERRLWALYRLPIRQRCMLQVRKHYEKSVLELPEHKIRRS